jgi:hypothetical protein
MTTTTITSLPNELLEGIAAAVPETERTLSHICRRLRIVMLGTPALWTHAAVDLHVKGSVEIFELYVARSQECTISATLQLRSELKDESTRDLVAERLRQIVRHIDRIGRLRVVGGGQLIVDSFCDLAAPNLRRLEVVKLGHSSWGGAKLFLGGAPKLTFLELHDLRLELPIPQWAASLTHLELRHDREELDGNSETLDEILVQCPLLMYLHLDIGAMKVQRQFHIPSLKSLFLVVSGHDDAYDWLATIDSFDTPSLTEFGIDGLHGDHIFELCNCRSFPRASFAALTSFCFVNRCACHCETSIPFPDIDTTSHPPFGLFPALSSLTLVNECFAPNLLRGLVVPSSDTWHVLGTVALTAGTTAAEGVRGAVLDAVRSHQQHGLPLPRFRLAPALSSLEDWEGHGIEVEKFEPAEVLDVFRVC